MLVAIGGAPARLRELNRSVEADPDSGHGT